MTDNKEEQPQSEIVQLPNAIYGRFRIPKTGLDEETIKKMREWAEEIDRKGADKDNNEREERETKPD